MYYRFPRNKLHECFEFIVRNDIGNMPICIKKDKQMPNEDVQDVRSFRNKKLMEIKDEKNEDGDIEIVFTGLRPGEKLYEELLIGGIRLSSPSNRRNFSSTIPSNKSFSIRSRI